MRRTMYLVLALATILGGCAHRWSPGTVPELSLETVPRFSERLSVDFKNNQSDTAWKLFAGIGGHTHYANYNEWTQFFINYWAEELKRRGAEVSENSPNKIYVKLDNFRFYQGFAKVRTNFDIELSSADGAWRKKYEETDTSGWSLGRAFGSLIYHSVEKLMNDPEVVARMRK